MVGSGVDIDTAVSNCCSRAIDRRSSSILGIEDCVATGSTCTLALDGEGTSGGGGGGTGTGGDGIKGVTGGGSGGVGVGTYCTNWFVL